MSKELYMEAHERLIEEAMEAYPFLSWSEAYERTADKAHARMIDMLADLADEAKDREKYDCRQFPLRRR